MRELHQLSATEIAAGVRAGEFSAVEVFDACCRRTEQVEPRVNAYLRFDPAGRERALDIDRRRQAGEQLGPLAGVPVALKDNLSLAGQPLTCGSRILEGYVAPYTATAVERLLGAGAVPLGQCNMDEFAMGSSCENSAFGPTHNPWHLGKVPGGSSGGPAAAVAAGSVPLALGSDTGGSIRQPAAMCGVVGLKPSWGRVSRYGLVAFASSTDQIGPLTRTVEDSALALGVMAGADSNDSTCSARPLDDYQGSLGEGVEGLRIGFVSEVDSDDMDAASQANWAAARQTLKSLGARLEEVSLPSLELAVACYYIVAPSEASANLARFDGVRYGRRAASDRGLAGLYQQSRSEGFGAEVKLRIMLGTFALSSGYYDAYYGRAQGVREILRAEMAAAFERVDVLVTPTTPGGAFKLGERTEEPLAMYLSDIYTTPASLVGLPAVSVPSGLDSSGMPLALQITAPPFAEALALRVGRAFEQVVGFALEPGFVPTENS